MSENNDIKNENNETCTSCNENPCVCEKQESEKQSEVVASNEESKEEHQMTLQERRLYERELRKQEKKERREQRLKEKEKKANEIPDMNWYVVHTYSGFEQKAKEALQERFKQKGLENYLGEIKIPQETVTEVVKGEKKKSTKKFFPGYILVQMRLNQDTWHMVKETPKISGFVGDASNPAPLLESDVELINTQVEEGGVSSRMKHDFEQGETVKVIDGPFTEFTGTIEEVKPDKGKLRVLISIFGRATPVELDFVQVEKC